jgi:hypothetical protein
MVIVEQEAWAFYAYEAQGEQPVQAWFDELSEEHRFEIADLLTYLRNITTRQWQRPEFDPLDGAGGISEIRCDLRDESGSASYRIYGYFGPFKGCYTFLFGTRKEARNDVQGKRFAKQRLDEIARGEAIVHPFTFET